MHRLLITSDLHQHRTKWTKLVAAVLEEHPAFVLVAGDILPKYDGFDRQRQFFPRLREHLAAIRDGSGARVLLYLANDDAHYLEPQVDAMEADGLCVNLNQRVYREGGLVFCGMNKVRDYPFGYKHYCVPDGDWVADPVQFCGQGITFDERGVEQRIPDLRKYLLAKPSLRDLLDDLKAKLNLGELERSIWVVHQPPSDVGMDICGHGQQVGSPALLRFVEENQPLLGCSGHIHESPHQPGGRWMARIGKTTWLQPGQVDDRLHYVMLDITDSHVVAHVRHSVFGR